MPRVNEHVGVLQLATVLCLMICNMVILKTPEATSYFPMVGQIWWGVQWNLNKGHLHTVGIVPYLEVVPYWEVFQKK